MLLSRAFPALALSAALLTLGTAAFAQDAASQRPLQQEMSPEEFKAAGLDKLSAEELARLNAWLIRQSGNREQVVREKMRDERKGFGSMFGGGSDVEPVVSKLVGEFRGWEGGTVFTLHNGQRWQLIDTPEYYVPKRAASQDPAVSISPSPMGAWRMQVEGHGVRAKVKRLK